MDPRHKRLAWRCRRGTRELDILLGGWLREEFAAASEAERTAFESLLEQQDPDLWDWLMARRPPPRADWQAIVDAIRTRHQL
ncbi:MAG TPA: succinate dehydrogenase assembly factor 2 [Rhodanobacteraceae bacterium]|nr:succinate dehydrogenase assembly factor 2 [Rhodanobacteraceae bacterium]